MLLFKKNRHERVCLCIASTALAAMSGLQISRVRNKLKEPDMTCEDKLAEEKEKSTYCCFDR